ncbi:MAG TPA: molybdopterin cofactor-binding domain-containing protein, partial [Dongiaceae bacterium]|nr:molybdopterin cofactor-binding domain-containing protein [Dongiaceae bacterium]
KAVDDSAAKKVPGFVRAVTLDDKTGTTSGWVVAVASSYPAAKKAAEALKVTYDNGPYAKVSDQTLIDEAKKLQQSDASGQLFVKKGDQAAAIAGAAKVMEAEYLTSINIHAPLEPMNALAYEQGGIWHIHTGNQFASRTGGVAAGALGVDPKKVVLHQYLIGGGFGRRLDADMVIPAVLASKAVAKPVKLIYAREDDMAMDFTRPLTYQKVKAGLDADGKLVGLSHDVVCAWPTARWGIPEFLTPAVDKKGPLDSFTVNGADFWYTVPNHQVRAILNELAQKATPSGQLRSVAPGWTFWAVESMIDELAHAAGKDPVDYRLTLLKSHPRHRDVLALAAARAGWGKELPKGRFHGVAVHEAFRTFVAEVAEVAVAGDGSFKVERVVCAVDCGIAVNPDVIRAQMEGGIGFGLSAALAEQVTLEGGKVVQSNFHDYTPLRIADMPRVEVHIARSAAAPTGVGEPAVPPIAPAVANALAVARNKPVRALPLRV